MKKKLIAIAIAGAIAAPLTAQAVDLSTDARVRYYSNTVSEYMGAAGLVTTETTGAVTDSRIGINIKAKNDDGVTLTTRLELDNTHGAAHNINVDRAYFNVPVAGLNITAGKTVGNWGHRVYVWDATGDRLHISKKMGDMVGAILFTKATENDSGIGIPATADDDADKSATSIIFKMGKMGGIRYDMWEDGKTANNTADDISWNTVDIYGGAPLGGGWGLAFELNSSSGDVEGSTVMLAAKGKVAGSGVMAGYVTVADGASTDADFLSFVGTGAEAGSMFASLTSDATAATAKSMNAVFAVGTVEISAATNLEVGVASVNSVDESTSGAGAGGDMSETVMSIKLAQKIGKATKLELRYGSLSGDMMTANQMGANLTTKF